MRLKIGSVVLSLFMAGCAQNLRITEADYARAESYLLPNMNKMVYHIGVQPNWLDDSTGFWHLAQTREGKRFFISELSQAATSVAFDHDRLASLLQAATGKPVEGAELPFDRIRYHGRDTISFRIEGSNWKYIAKSGNLLKDDTLSAANDRRGISPDGRYQAFTRDYNLYVRDLDTKEEIQLSSRGEYLLEYANPYGWSDIMEGEGGKRPQNFFVSWSPDSRKLLTYLVDLRAAEKMYLLDFSVDTLFRPRLLSYYRGSPGDTTLVYNIPVIFDLETKREVTIDLPPFPHFIGVPFTWSEGSDSLHALYPHRGFKRADVIKADAATGTTVLLFSETSDTSVEYTKLIVRRLKDNKLLFSSEQSGWHHLYLYDWNSGKQVSVLTSGNYVVNGLVHVDEDKEWVYFLAGGKEQGRNPYYNHLYRVKYDGGGMELLTPENAHHVVSISPCKKYFVDNYSRTDLPTVSVVRELETGMPVFKVSEADISDLLATGWRPPMQFVTKGRDGMTDIYGVIYRPAGFHPRNKYPLIDYSYTGPHISIVPKSFSDAVFNITNPLTAFGFLVMVVDGMGTSYRSKAFRDVSYRNMGSNLECHVGAIRQLSQSYSWIDTTRIGIYGHSAGGYDAARAMLQYPDFYKVGVASAADHDHRMEKAWWPEMYMGYPVEAYYHEQSNVTNAGKLQGRLLIAHGAIDENVNPSATYKLAENLIREGKDFDMLILPGSNHSFGRSEGDYFTKVRWNYFIKHLLPASPVHNYRFRTILRED